MSKLLKKLMLMTALFVSMATMAQSRETTTLTVCDGTNTSNVIPFYGDDYASARFEEFIIPASELQSMNGGSISAMHFYHYSGGNNDPWPGNWRVFLIEVNYTNLDTYVNLTNLESNATLVYYGTLNRSMMINNIPFNGGNTYPQNYSGNHSSNYIYQGGNLLVVLYKESSSSTNQGTVMFYGVSTDYFSSRYVRSTDNYGYKFIPKTTFTYEPATAYTIAVSANPTEGGTVTGSGSYYGGTDCTVTAIANEGYNFINWKENDVVVSTDANYTFTVEGDRTLMANFAAAYTITAAVNPTESGTITGAGSYVSGESCTLTATANEGYTFANWTKNDTEVSTDASYTFTVSESAAYVANFTVNSYEITATASPMEGGIVTGAGTYEHGVECTLTATANEGYTFTRWTKDGTEVSTNTTYTFNATEAANYVAVFAHIYTIDVTVDPEDGGSIIGSGTYNEGEFCELEAVPASGYTFVNWTENDEVVSTDANYSFTVTGNRDLVAHFALRSCIITVAADPVSGGTVTGGGTYEYGTHVTLEAIPNSESGYSFVQWNKNGSFASSNATYSFTVRNNGDYVAVFTRSCSEPTGLAVADLTATLASLSWTGDANNYNVRYRTVTITDITDPTTEDFSSYMASSPTTQYNNADKPSDWAYSSSSDFYGPLVSNNSVLSSSAISAMSNQGNFLYMNSYANCYAVMPRMDDLSAASFKYACMYESSNMGGTFKVGYVTNTSDITGTFTAFTDVSTPRTKTLTTVTLTTDDINILNNTEGARLAFYFSPTSNSLAIDDITVTYPHSIVDAGEWVYQNNITNSPATITNLIPSTLYEAQVQAACYDDLQSDWSESVNFTTLTRYEKTISGYGQSEGGYYLIASPVGNIIPRADNGFIVNDYDLYRFNQSQPRQEWENWKNNGSLNGFNIESGKGYLYANKVGTTLFFDGTPYNGNGQVPLVYDESAEFPGWNLIGNPFVTSANLDRPYYRLNPDGSALRTETEDSEVAVMEGVFVQATEAGTATFTQSELTRVAKLNLSVICSHDASEGSKAAVSTVIDNAIVRFDDGAMLGKFQLREGGTKLYVPQGSKDYAVVSAPNEGEIPVNFKAEKDGTYTINVETDNVEMNYLHLIDNKTGADIDLLHSNAVIAGEDQQSPSYTFYAKTTDYASRFRLVFAAKNEDGATAGSETFAFFNNGSFVINNEGNATLQVVDVMGHVLSSESINGTTTKAINAAKGVYMLRLINGDSVKVQKVVVR